MNENQINALVGLVCAAGLYAVAKKLALTNASALGISATEAAILLPLGAALIAKAGRA